MNQRSYLYIVILLPLIVSCSVLQDSRSVNNYDKTISELSDKLKAKDHQLKLLQAKNLALSKTLSMKKNHPVPEKKSRKIINPEELEFEIPQQPEKMLAFIRDEYSKTQYNKSLTATDLFIQQYENSKYLDQVYYYRALNYKSLKKYAWALRAFSEVENKFLLSPFRPDSLLQKAEIYQIMNLNSYQQRTLYKLIRQYPKSKEARLAHLELNTN